MTESPHILVPIKIRPRLPKGRLHKLLIDSSHFHILSWENLYGNSASESILSIPHSDILNVKFKMPASPSFEGKCTLSYQDHTATSDTAGEIKFSSTGPHGHVNNELTAAIASALDDIRWQRFVPPVPPLIITLKPPSAMLKFFTGFALFAGTMLVAGLSMDFSFIGFLGLFLFFPSLIALGIDYIRLHTAWPTPIKLLAYVLIFVFGFFLMALTFSVVDASGIFRR